MESIQVAKFLYGFRQKALQKINWNKMALTSDRCVGISSS